APPDITQRLHHNASRPHQVPAPPMLVSHIQVTQHFQRVMNRLHPRRQLLFQRSRQKSKLFPHRNRRTRHHKSAELPVHHRSLQSSSHRQERFARARLSHQRHKLDSVI